MKRIAPAVWAFALVITGCDGGSATNTTNTTLTVETPAESGLPALAELQYSIRSATGPASAGSLALQAVSSAQDGETARPLRFWRSAFFLPVDTYELELVGRNQRGDVICANSNAFETSEDLPTEVHHVLGCDDPLTNPTGEVVITVQAPEGAGLDDAPEFRASIRCGDASSETQVFRFSALPLFQHETADFGQGPVRTAVWRSKAVDLPAGPCRLRVEEAERSDDRTCVADIGFTVTAYAATPVGAILPCAPEPRTGL